MQGCPYPSEDGPATRLYLQFSLPPQADSTKLSAIQISVPAVLTGINPGTLFACCSGILQCQGIFCQISTSRISFWHFKKVDKNTLLPFRKIIHHLFYMNVGNRAGIKEMSSLQYAQTSEWEGFPNKLLPKSRFRLAASTSGTSGKAGRSMTENAGSLEAALGAWNHTDAWAVDLCLGKTDRPEKVEVTC